MTTRLPLALLALGACGHHPIEHPRVQIIGGSEPRAAVPPPVMPTRFGAECVGVIPPAEPRDTTRDYHHPRHLVVMPPLPVPRAMRGTTVQVRMRYRADGDVDSIQVLGAADSTYAKRYVAAIEGGFRNRKQRGESFPAVFKGCAVDSWHDYSTHFQE